MVYDVAIVGAGVVGAAMARELSRYELRCILLEAKSDVGMGTSKANTAIWHTGFDAKPGSLESSLLQRSYPLLEQFMAEANLPVERVGGLLVAWTDEQYRSLPGLLERAHDNKVTDVRQVTGDELYRMEPHLNSGALGGLLVPGESILCTFSIPLAFATQALLNGVTLKLNFPVNSVFTKPDGEIVLEGHGESVSCRYLVNAAGLHADTINKLLGHDTFTISPRRGELLIFDKLARSLVNHVILPVPTATTKGVLIGPTVYGNVLLGPTAEDIDDITDTATTASGLESLWSKGEAILPELMQEEVTATYAGLRPATQDSDYQIELHADQRYVCVGGIRSTGVSASMGIAEYVRELLESAGLNCSEKSEFKPVSMPNIGEAFERPYQCAEKIGANPDYGRILCHCERVSLGEIIDATESPLPATSLDALRRRTRVLQGRCQGFNCLGAVVATLARRTGRSPRELLALGASDGE